MLAVAHEARLAKPSNPKDPESRSVRQDLEALRARGVRVPQLDEPEYPEHVEYLRTWSQRLHGRSGLGMGAIAPLSDVELVAWMIATGERPSPDEVEALMLLDAVRRDPSIVNKPVTADGAATQPVATPKASRPSPASRWPARKQA